MAKRQTVHRTKDSSDKYQYNPIDVSANFDYPKELEIYEQNAKNNAKKIKMTEKLDDLYNGKITREEFNFANEVCSKLFEEIQANKNIFVNMDKKELIQRWFK